MKKRIVVLSVFFSFFTSSIFAANNPKELFEEATIAYNQGNFDQSIALYQKMLEFFPKFAPAHNFLGLAHKAKGSDPNEIISHFERAIEYDPNYAQAYDNLGKIYYGLGNFNLAEKNCLKAYQLDPELVSAELSLAWIYLLGKSNPRQAIVFFKKTIERNPLPYAYYGLGLAYLKNKQKLNAFEAITALHSMGQEELASQLEAMVRDNNVRLPMGPQEADLSTPQQGTLVGNSFEDDMINDSNTNMKVRLRSPKSGLSSGQSEGRDISGGERIKELQKRSSQLPAANDY